MLLWDTLPKEFCSNSELVKCTVKSKCAHFIFVVIFRDYWKQISFSQLSETFISPVVSKSGYACHLTFILLQFSSWCICIKPQTDKWALLWLHKRAIIKETSHTVWIKDRKPLLFFHSIFPGWETACSSISSYIYVLPFFLFSNHFYPFLSCICERYTGILRQ